jgi:D-serine deaminase-like pyridoxal phosphate-dependent protein
MDALGGGGYGEVRALDLAALPGSPGVESLNQVHGRVVAAGERAGERMEGLAVGERVRVLPNHACLTAAMFDRYFVLDGDRVVFEWPRLRG